MNSKIIIRAYRSLLKEASKIESYNFKDFAFRRIKHQFRTEKHYDEQKIKEQIKQMNRISLIQNTYL